MNYCVVTADVRRSREVQDRRALQEKILLLLNEVNQQEKEALAVPFSITLGDEWQGVLRGCAAGFWAAIRFVEELFPYRLSVGIGYGSIETGLLPRSAEMDGVAFHRSRAALEQAKDTGQEILFSLGRQSHDLILNAASRLLQLVRQDWTASQFEKLRLFKQLGTERSVAEELGISQQSVNKALQAIHARTYLEQEQRILRFLELEYGPER
ncbi:MAG TPA: hypothetical protein ENI85_03725 [Deltaproteobacteria bacterium]|nr:hypothetical protein [Deltaproteobacteria bacterium]